MTRVIDAHQMLERAILDVLRDACLRVSTSWSRPWASITFSGSRHIWTLEPNGGSALQWSEAHRTLLQDHEFELPGHIVADLVAEMIDGALKIEALTVESA